MNAAQLHLAVNHLPIIFPIVGVIVLVTGVFSKTNAVKRTGFMIFILGAITAIFATLSGGGAAEIVFKIDGISEQHIKKHKDSASVFAILSYILGGISIVGLWASFKQKYFANFIVMFNLLFALIVVIFGKATSTSGGEIRHTEIRSDYQVPLMGDNN